MYKFVQYYCLPLLVFPSYIVRSVALLLPADYLVAISCWRLALRIRAEYTEVSASF